MVEVMRKNHFKADVITDFQEFNQQDFVHQQETMKNIISKMYSITILTSFNERTVFAVVGKDVNGNYFYAIDKNALGQISVEELKALL